MAIHQISVFLENRAGQLAEITALLAKNGASSFKKNDPILRN